MAQLRRWEDRCEDGRAEILTVIAEDDTDEGRRRIPLEVEVEIFEEAVAGESYYVPGDPSLGLDDPEHDPCGCHVYRRDPMRLVARYNGYCGAYGLGMVMAHFAERYNDALVDVDMTGGYGGPTLTALDQYRSARHSDGYRNINRDLVVDAGDKWRTKLGFVWNEANKAGAIEAVRAALHEDSVRVPSRAVVECLKQAVMDNKQRLAKPAGVHYEDFCNLGRALQVIRPTRTFADMRAPEIQAEDKLAAALKGYRPDYGVRRPGRASLKWRR
jgi:hypothetical protein